ncbi:MAG: hypothetical protein C0478_11370 [Planctomyces sp.]|nr:hypothetical protein [Planctomyces sp.]
MTTLIAPIAFQPQEVNSVGAFILVPTLGGAPWILRRGRHVIGSGPEATLRLANEGIKPQHCLLIVGPTSAIVKSWDSRTWINDGPVKEATLRPNDRLTIGPWTFRFRAATADELLQYVPQSEKESQHVDGGATNAAAPSTSTIIRQQDLPAAESVAEVVPVSRIVAPFVDDTPVAPVVESQPVIAQETKSRLENELQRTLASVMEQRLHLEQMTLDHTQVRTTEKARLAEQRAELERLRTQLVRRETETSVRLQAIEASEAAQQMLRKELERTQISLLQRQTELAEADRAWRQQVAERTGALETRQGELERRESELAARLAEHAEQQMALDNFQQTLAHREAKLRDEQASWEAIYTNKQAECADLDARLAQVETRAEELALREQSLGRLEAELSAKDSELSQVRAELSRREEEICQVGEATVAEKELLAREVAQQAVRSSELAAKEADLGERITAMETRERALASERLRIEELATSTRAALIEEQSQQQATWDRWDESMRRTSAELRTQMEELERERAAIEEAQRLAASRENRPAETSCDEMPVEVAADSVLQTAPSIVEESPVVEAYGESESTIEEPSPEVAVVDEVVMAADDVAAANVAPVKEAPVVFLDTPGTVDWLPVTPGESYVASIDHAESAAAHDDQDELLVGPPVAEYEETVATWSSGEQPVDAAAFTETGHDIEEYPNRFSIYDVMESVPSGTFSDAAVESVDGEMLAADVESEASPMDVSPFADESDATSFPAASFDDSPLNSEGGFGEPLASRRLWNDVAEEGAAVAVSPLATASKEPQEEDRAASLRAELAQLFGIQDLGTARAPADEAARPEEIFGPVSENDEDTEVAQSETASESVSDSNVSLETARAVSASAVNSATEPAAVEVSTVTEASSVASHSVAPVAAEEEEDSVASYMARLLGRYGQRSSGTEEAAARPVREAALPVAPAKGYVAEAPLPNEEPVAWSNEPRHKVDKNEFRAHMESMRQVANVSARKAVKSSHWKRSRMQVMVRGLLAAAALATGSVLLLGKFANGRPQLMQGLVVTVVGIYLLFDTVRSFRRIQNSVRLQAALADSAHLEAVAEGAGAEAVTA